MSPQRSLALLVVTAMMLLAVLAHASPPDPNWIGGFWDNADYDDVVLLVTSGVGVTDTYPTHETLSVVIVSDFLSVSDKTPLSARSLGSSYTRAPPA